MGNCPDEKKKIENKKRKNLFTGSFAFCFCERIGDIVIFTQAYFCRLFNKF